MKNKSITKPISKNHASKKATAKKPTSTEVTNPEPTLETHEADTMPTHDSSAGKVTTVTTPTPAQATDNGASIIYVPQPPADAKIPAPPAGFVPTAGTDYRGVVPKKAHMAAMPQVVDEMSRATDFDQIFGKTAPPYQYTKQMLTAANGWSGQRAQMRSWDLYCRTQEGLAWRETHALMARLGPAFALAAATDSTVAGRYPGMARLFGVTKQIGQKGAQTRKANKKQVAEGKPPLKGAVGKKRAKQAEKALFEASLASAATPPVAAPAPAPQPQPIAAPVVQPAPSQTPAQALAQPAAPIAAVAPATPAAPTAPPAPTPSAPAPASTTLAVPADAQAAPAAPAAAAPATGGSTLNGAGH